jgi:hypothetical protein
MTAIYIKWALWALAALGGIASLVGSFSQASAQSVPSSTPPSPVTDVGSVIPSDDIRGDTAPVVAGNDTPVDLTVDDVQIVAPTGGTSTSTTSASSSTWLWLAAAGAGFFFLTAKGDKEADDLSYLEA